MNLRVLLSGHVREIAIEAAYYAVRALKQSSVPRDVRKAHLWDASESEPSAEAQELSAEILRLIESIEGRPIDELDSEQRTGYISELAGIAREFTTPKLRDEGLGTRLLEQLRRG